MTQVARSRGAFALLAAALLIAGIHAAAVRGLADAHYTRARLALSDAQASLRAAAALEPSNPLFVEMLARLHETQALARAPGDAEARALLGQSLDEFRAAARMRPGSPYAWASIALLKLRLGEPDAEFHGALERAARFGPWEPLVQVAIADAGLAAWRRLAPPAKALVVANLERALLRQAPEVRRITTAHGTLPLVCTSAALPPRLAALCVKI